MVDWAPSAWQSLKGSSGSVHLSLSRSVTCGTKAAWMRRVCRATLSSCLRMRRFMVARKHHYLQLYHQGPHLTQVTSHSMTQWPDSVRFLHRTACQGSWKLLTTKAILSSSISRTLSNVRLAAGTSATVLPLCPWVKSRLLPTCSLPFTVMHKVSYNRYAVHSSSQTIGNSHTRVGDSLAQLYPNTTQQCEGSQPHECGGPTLVALDYFLLATVILSG